MAFSLQMLLRLPPALRYQSLSPALFHPSTTDLCGSVQLKLQVRSFNATKVGLRPKSPPKPTVKRQPLQNQAADPRASRPPTIATAASPDKTGRVAPPPSPSRSKPPEREIAAIPRLRDGMTIEPPLRRLLETNPEILLYRSPSHTSFYLTCYLAGATFLLGSFETAQLPLFGTVVRPWYFYLTFVPGALFLSVAGTVFLLGPKRLIQRIWIVAAPKGSSPTLRIQAKSPLPFLPSTLGGAGKTLSYLELRSVMMDKKITNTLLPHANIPYAQAEAFTYDQISRPTPEGSRASRFFHGLRRNVAKMFMRDGIAYLRIQDQGEWKMDLDRCWLLERGQPLLGVVKAVEMHRWIFTRVSGLLRKST